MWLFVLQSGYIQMPQPFRVVPALVWVIPHSPYRALHVLMRVSPKATVPSVDVRPVRDDAPVTVHIIPVHTGVLASSLAAPKPTLWWEQRGKKKEEPVR